MSTKNADGGKSDVECPTCADVFNTSTAMKAHHQHHEKTYHEAVIMSEYGVPAEWLIRTQYNVLGRTFSEIADILCVSNGAIYKMKDRYSIETQKPEKITTECSYCGASLQRQPARFKDGKPDFCKPQHHDLWRRETPEAGASVEFTESDCIEAIREKADELGHPPDFDEYVSGGPSPSAHTIINRIGSWSKAKELALPSVAPYTDEECLDALRESVDRLGHTPSVEEYRALDIQPPATTIISRFGSWNPAKKEAGIDTRPSGGWPHAMRRGTGAPLWVAARETRKAVVHRIGPDSWRVSRNKARTRDGYTCQMCGVGADDREGPVDVHHLVPIMSGGTNALDNLMTLCRSCHMKTEQHTRRFTDPLLTDWSDDELPGGRERWMPDDTPTEIQPTLDSFAPADD